MLTKSLSKIIPFAVLLIAVYSVQRYAVRPIGNTVIWWPIEALILFSFFAVVRYSQMRQEDRQAMQAVKWFMLWNVFSIIRGIFVAENYWDYKGLIGMSMGLLIAVAAYIALDKERVRAIFAFFIKYALPLAIVLFPLQGSTSWGWYLFPVSVLMFFLPVLPIRGKIIVIIVTIIAGFADLGTRSHVIKYGLPIILLLVFYSSRHFSLSGKLMKVAQKVLIVMPLIFFTLAISGIFEIFKLGDYIQGDLVETKKSSDGEVVEEDLKMDTRTFLYVEVLQSAKKHNYWLIGRSPARGNDTVAFADWAEEITGRPERLRNEVGILNTFTWTGVVGVVLFFLVFYRASFLAVYRSKNIFLKLIGLFVAFRWAYSWAEDYQGFDMNNFVLWLMIGMCFSSSFREMNDTQVKLWAWGIFDRSISQRFKKYEQEKLVNSIQ
tara:strand:+ start:9134 stop:10438 length:1305 start_codon:yes stop_codon:yes gene_type:complete